MDISIIIPVHRSGLGILHLLDSIERQVGAPEHEVIIVANPPHPLLERAARERKNVKYVETAIIGANSARNLGLNMADGKILLFVDDDCIMHEQSFLFRHWLAHKTNKEIAGIGGHYCLPPNSGRLAKAYQFLQTSWVKESPQPGYHSDLLLGGNMSFKREALERERFDPALTFGGTETELVFRLNSVGLRTKLFGDLSIQHIPKDGFIRFLLKAVKQGCGSAFLRRRNYHGVPLVIKGEQLHTTPPSLAIAFCVSLHKSFFRAGLVRGQFSGRFIEAQMLMAGAWETAIEPLRRLNFFFFVEIRGVLRSVLLLRKLGLVGATKGDRAPVKRD